MLRVTLIAVGNLKESYLREAFAEYEKRLGGFCRFETVQIKETPLSEEPSDAEISRALEAEGEKILAAMPPKAERIALCVEGKQLSSEELAEKLDEIGKTHGAVAFVIGSSYGLSPAVKQACGMKLSVSKLTFPHQLMRVILLETVYRSLSILRGSKYHK